LGVPDALAQAELDGLPELGEKAPGLTGKAAQEPENRMALDQNGEDDYTKKGNGAQSGEEAGTIGFIGTAGSAAAVPVSAGDSPDSVDELPDLGSLSSAFLPSGGESDSEAPMPPPSMPEPPGGAAKKQGAGDFNLKEMASAIQTILKRD
ncbi:MAG: hypothetical protein LBU21_06210, partial [Treponema sp.]|nr:hypothetical protein [Treponema sp.]